MTKKKKIEDDLVLILFDQLLVELKKNKKNPINKKCLDLIEKSKSIWIEKQIGYEL